MTSRVRHLEPTGRNETTNLSGGPGRSGPPLRRQTPVGNGVGRVVRGEAPLEGLLANEWITLGSLGKRGRFWPATEQSSARCGHAQPDKDGGCEDSIGRTRALTERRRALSGPSLLPPRLSHRSPRSMPPRGQRSGRWRPHTPARPGDDADLSGEPASHLSFRCALMQRSSRPPRHRLGRCASVPRGSTNGWCRGLGRRAAQPSHGTIR